MMRYLTPKALFTCTVLFFMGCAGEESSFLEDGLPERSVELEERGMLPEREVLFDLVPAEGLDDQAWFGETFYGSESGHALFEKGEPLSFVYPEPFQQVGILIDADELHDFSYRVVEPGGEVGPWEPVILTFSEGKIHNGLILLSEPRKEVEIQGARGVSYARFEFSRERLAPEELVFQVGEQPAGIEIAEDEALRSRSQAVAPADLVISRHEWGAFDPDRVCNNVVPPYRMAVHHTAGPNSEGDPFVRMRSIQNFHINSRGWCDIGYHFVVAPGGEIMQGRSRSDRPGAHVGNHNAGNVGLCMMGTYTDVTPSEAMIDGIVEIMKWVHRTHDVPLDRSAILGHREHQGAATECPGTRGVTFLDGMVERAAEEVGFEEGAEVLLWVESNAEDFVAQGSSSGVKDALTGETVEVSLYLSNQTRGPLRGVRLGYLFPGERVRVLSYRIESDAPALDGESFDINDAHNAPGNPPHESPGTSAELVLFALGVGETKRVVFEVEPLEYDFGSSSRLVETWVRNIDDLYAQNTHLSSPSLNPYDWNLQGSLDLHIFSPLEWRFDGPEDQDLEGWTNRDGTDLGLFVQEGTLQKRVERPLGGLVGPDYLRVDAGQFNELVLTMELPEGRQEVLIYGPESEGLRFEAQGGTTETYLVPLRDLPGWVGEVDRLVIAFDLLAPGDIRVDEVYFQHREEERTSSPVREFIANRPVAVLRDSVGAASLLGRAEEDLEVLVLESGCSTTGSSSSGFLILVVCLGVVLRRRLKL